MYRQVQLVGGLVLSLLAFACSDENSPSVEPDACEATCGDGAYCDTASARCFCEVGFAGDPQVECRPHDDTCAEAKARVGHSVCELQVRDPSTFTVLSIGHGKDPSVSRAVKYLVPAKPDARLPVSFIDTNWYRTHHCFISQGFEPLFPGSTYTDYKNLVIEKDLREYYGGTISELSELGPDGPRYVFSVETYPVEEALLSVDEIYGVFRQIEDRFSVGALSYIARQPIYVEQAMAWEDPPFPITILPEAVGPQYEAYTPGLAYGWVRRFTDAEFVEAGAAAFGWQDILVLETPPLVLEGVMAASVTSGRQDILTHLNVLSALRGTPNLKVANALDVFAPYDGQLVRLEAFADYYSIRQATVEEAGAYWTEQRPSAELNAPPDREYGDLVSLDEIPVDTSDARRQAVSRFGSKASGLAVLRSVGDTDHIVRGFGIPMGAYFAFMDANSWEAPVVGGTQTATYAETITLWLADDDFLADRELRATWLQSLREEMTTNGVVDPMLLDTVRAEIATVVGDANTMVRFRSSSNAEDSLTFNGAGLYDSVSGCGPDVASDSASTCEPDRGPKPVAVALKRVWASLWYFGAYEEREFYRLGHSDVGMGVLVNPRFAFEQANGVVFTGNPTDPDDPRLTINVQVGEVPVVNATPGTIAELDRVLVKNGKVVSIARETASSLVAQGEFVLDNDRLAELVELLSDVAAVYPVDATPPPGTTVMLDAEFKITADGDLILKQIRPFAAHPYQPDTDNCR